MSYKRIMERGVGDKIPPDLSSFLLSDDRKISAAMARSFLGGTHLPLPNDSLMLGTQVAQVTPFASSVIDHEEAEDQSYPLRLSFESASSNQDLLDGINGPGPDSGGGERNSYCAFLRNNEDEVEDVNIGMHHSAEAQSSQDPTLGRLTNFLNILEPNKVSSYINQLKSSLLQVNTDELLSSTADEQQIDQDGTIEETQILLSSSDDEIYYDCKSTASEDKENFESFLEEDGASGLESECSNFNFEDSEMSGSDTNVAEIPTSNVDFQNRIDEVEVDENSNTLKGSVSTATSASTNVNKSLPRLTTSVEGNEIDALVGPTDQYPELVWLVKFKHKHRFDLVPATCMNKFFPQSIIQFYERRIRCSNNESFVEIDAL